MKKRLCNALGLASTVVVLMMSATVVSAADGVRVGDRLITPEQRVVPTWAHNHALSPATETAGSVRQVAQADAQAQRRGKPGQDQDSPSKGKGKKNGNGSGSGSGSDGRGSSGSGGSGNGGGRGQ